MAEDTQGQQNQWQSAGWRVHPANHERPAPWLPLPISQDDDIRLVVQETQLNLARYQRYVNSEFYETRAAFQELESDMKRELGMLRRKLDEDFRGLKESQARVLEACSTLARQQQDLERLMIDKFARGLAVGATITFLIGAVALKVLRM